MIRILHAAMLIALLAFPSSAHAGWKLMPANRPATIDSILTTPTVDWNQNSSRPGKQGRLWTRDGPALNSLEFFSGVPSGQPMYRERNRKRDPMPRFDATALLPELADFFERSFRTANQVSDYTVLESAPVMLGRARGLKLRYRYSLPNDELTREGEIRIAVVKGKLYAVNFHAPRLHYFPAGLPEAQAIMDAARLK